MKLMIICSLMALMSNVVSAKDKCSSMVNVYIEAMETVSNASFMEDIKRKKAIENIKEIKRLQKTLSDCDVQKKINKLKTL